MILLWILSIIAIIAVSFYQALRFIRDRASRYSCYWRVLSRVRHFCFRQARKLHAFAWH